jgi:hypothetical protein
MFSWNCPHCNLSVVHQGDPGISEWQQEAILLSPCGDRISGSYDGYGHLNDTEITDYMMNGGSSILAHKACWEVAGKPDHKFYAEKGLKSTDARDQGHFFNDDHDLIDPRITNPEERTRLLETGRAARTVQQFNAKAELVGGILVEAKRLPPESRWMARYSIWEKKGGMAGHCLTDKLGGLAGQDMATLEEVAQLGQSLWGQWVESEEFQTFKLRHEEMVAERQLRHIENLKREGRFDVIEDPRNGDVVETDRGTRTHQRYISSVRDNFTYKNVMVFDAPFTALGIKHIEIRGSDSMAWAARTEELKATRDESVRLARMYANERNRNMAWAARTEELKAARDESVRLARMYANERNREWADAGYPVDGITFDEVD